jgi:sodium/hydrogen antiporter
MELLLATIGGLTLVVGLLSRLLHRSPATEPMLGLALGVVLGPHVLGLTALPEADEIGLLHLAAKLSLALSLMAVALRFSLDNVRAHLGPLAVLLTVVLVAMAAASAGAAALVLGLPVAAAWALGAMLAPTDPILASSIVAGDLAERDLPLRTRILISLESGGNDGLSQPLVAAGIAAVLATGTLGALAVSLAEVVWGVVLGAAIGIAAGRLLVWSERHRDIEHSAFLVLSLALALFSLGAVGLAGGSGEVGVLVAGLAYGHELSQAERSEEWEIQDAVNHYLILPVFVLLGLALPWEAWAALGWQGPALVVTVLLVRRLPIVLLLHRGLKVRPFEAGFIGWFGPIGVAALLHLTHGIQRGAVDDTMWAAGTMIIAASTLAHGLPAAWARRRYARLAGS